MLQRSDFDTFVELVRLAERKTAPSQPIHPDTVLRAAPPTEGLLHRNELARLGGSLKIASVAEVVPDLAHQILHTIVRNLSDEGFIYLPPTHSKEWLEAIAWALSHPATPASDYLPQLVKDRRWAVGKACGALRDRGYDGQEDGHSMVDRRGQRIWFASNY